MLHFNVLINIIKVLIDIVLALLVIRGQRWRIVIFLKIFIDMCELKIENIKYALKTDCYYFKTNKKVENRLLFAPSVRRIEDFFNRVSPVG